MRPWRMALVGLLWAGWALAADYERDPIQYSVATPDNLASRLQKRLVAGEVTFTYDAETGYLRSLLNNLKVPLSSQTLVFSKTSLQRHKIAPRTPRALYFNDDMYIGFCKGGDVLEVSAVDPQLGTVFYTVDQDPTRKPRFTRHTDNCLLCHGSSQTQGVPGHVIRSVFSDSRGLPMLSEGTYRVDHTTPFDKRWGGWYVTGTHGKQEHLGNLLIRTPRVARPVENAAGHNLTDLGDRFVRSGYLTPHSDIVALMVFEHQATGHNYITRANFETRQALHMQETLNREMKLPATHEWDSTRARIRSVGDDLVEYFLFKGEAPLTEQVRGTSGFAEEFVKRGPRDARGRSLREFDLTRRLFRYPMSYLIYTESFDALPDRVRLYVLERLHTILTGKDTTKRYDYLAAEDRQAILDILVATKPNLPAYWKAGR
ncbi:MAG: hypothetical protein U0840_19600 [Gemmataceae bacterium]